MLFRLLGRRLVNDLARLLYLAILVGIGWLVLQFYSVEELKTHALNFWSWWVGLINGEYERYWNPVGAALVLTVIGSAILRFLLPPRRGGRHGYSGGDYDGDGDGGDGGD
jgi:hypothetical protein